MANVFLDNTIGLLLRWNGLYGLIVLTAAITLLVVVIYKYTSNQEALKKIREDNVRLSEEMKQYKDDPKKIMELQKEQFKNGFFESFKHTMVPMLITMLPLLFIFVYLRTFYANNGNPIALFGSNSGWIWAYIISSIIFNMVFRKALKVY